jgi:drug/metabolite transporter (DMT)-like permease
MAHTNRKSIYLVLGCTLFAAAAQVLIKSGAANPLPVLDFSSLAKVVGFGVALVSNTPLFFGYCLSAGTALLLILALRDGELSTLYPIIAMSYVWAIPLSMYYFGDKLNIWKISGIALIVGGVALLGRAGAPPSGAVEITTPRP